MVDAVEVAAKTGMSVSKTSRLIANGEIASVLIGRRRKVPLAAIEAYLKRLQEPQQLHVPGMRRQRKGNGS